MKLKERFRKAGLCALALSVALSGIPAKERAGAETPQFKSPTSF
jgi:hypothetical protein